MHVLQTQPDFNAAEPDGIVAKEGGISPRREFLRLGAELSNRGQQPVSQFVSELADLPPEVVAEVRARLQAYCRIDAATYAALGGDVFTRYMIAIPGGRK